MFTKKSLSLCNTDTNNQKTLYVELVQIHLELNILSYIFALIKVKSE